MIEVQRLTVDSLGLENVQNSGDRALVLVGGSLQPRLDNDVWVSDTRRDELGGGAKDEQVPVGQGGSAGRSFAGRSEASREPV